VVAALKGTGAARVLDLGCGEGRVLQALLKGRQFVEIAGMDVSHRALEMARDRLHYDRMPLIALVHCSRCMASTKGGMMSLVLPAAALLTGCSIRVPMGKTQVVLYGHFTNRANVPGNYFVRAGRQIQWLRNICADPAGFTHGGPKVESNFNPKVCAILELTADMLQRGEQVVIVNSRKGLTNTLADHLCECGPIALIDSTVTAERHAYRAKLLKSRRAKVMFMGIKSAAAYSFDDVGNLILGSLGYSYGSLAQASGRVERVVNKVKKNIYVILHRNSLEEVMYDTVAIKSDAASLCLRGKRTPRDFRPVDAVEVLAEAFKRFSLDGTTPETEREDKWSALRQRIKYKTANGYRLTHTNSPRPRT
jgi:hypothetical protein